MADNPKVFNVDQIRLNGKLLTGSATGSLHYGGTQLAIGGNAVPTHRTIILGDGLAFQTGTSTFTDREDLSLERKIILHADTTNYFMYDGGSPAKLQIKNSAIGQAEIDAAAIGAGLEGGGGQQVKVDAGSGIDVTNGQTNIAKSGVLNSMLSGQISDDKLNQITTALKVKGGAVTLENTSLGTGVNGGLKISDRGVTATHVHSDLAGAGLAGGNNGASSSNFSVGAGTGITVDADNVNISLLGVDTAQIKDAAVTNDKLATISAAGKIQGAAVTLHENGGIDSDGTSKGLKISGQGVAASHLGDIAGDGLIGGAGSALAVGSGSGILIDSNGVNISGLGVTNDMLAGSIGASKLAGGIGLSKLGLTFGDGITGNSSSDTIAVDLKSTRPGLEFHLGELGVDHTVIRGDSSATQTLSGNYSFKNDLTCLSGLVINGDLEVRGDTLVTEQNQVNIGDTIIVLNANYPSDQSAPPDAGIEIERGALDNAQILFDDDGTDKWQAGLSGSLYRIETQQYNRAWSAEIASGVCYYHLSYGQTFESVPSVTVSLQHTGAYGVENPDLLGAMVTGSYTTGVHVAFTANTPNSGYYLNVHAVVA